MGDPQQRSAVKLVAHTLRGCASLFGSEPIGLRAPESVVHAPSPFLSGGSPRGPSWRGKRLSQSPAPGSWIEAGDTEQTHKRGPRVRDRPKTRISGGRGNLRLGGQSRWRLLWNGLAWPLPRGMAILDEREPLFLHRDRLRTSAARTFRPRDERLCSATRVGGRGIRSPLEPDDFRISFIAPLRGLFFPIDRAVLPVSSSAHPAASFTLLTGPIA
jgi:hypothetical protein